MLRLCYLSDIGRVRTVNEDRAVVKEDLNGWSLAIVADGMGGHQAGDIASQMAVELIQVGIQFLDAGVSSEERQRQLKSAIEVANEKVFEFASQREHYHGMGTTVVAALASPDRAVIAHIGDSRAYRIGGGRIEQLTEDHSLVNELVKSGQISREEASHHPRRNVLTRALGTEPTIEVDVQEVSWQKGDLLLLCSDGLCGLVDDERILEAASGPEELEEKARRLIKEALDAGGDDNVTVVLVANDGAGPEISNDGEAR
ncbi:Stp1/IreP family PP2C-type Ser/Thr phosphatase [Paenibacillus mucilaginosus]|nr:Stp1/IreP family PP2C-type Ser/Thr phosphatase [Paenibacillus mucilaginosus]MCG7213803.1 Stp1/IreP family PP2C-type Ser/Thr phosphatase [Paenibacillus mucilaginosus]WDM31373.1 Stp1/IreP family PP2C-type Ser/Thr phosphatase [Paenibacillus mucilaginosus]